MVRLDRKSGVYIALPRFLYLSDELIITCLIGVRIIYNYIKLCFFVKTATNILNLAQTYELVRYNMVRLDKE